MSYAGQDTRAPYRKVIDAALDELGLTGEAREEISTMLSLDMTRQMNMCGGRPSDCARSAVWELKSYGIEAYTRRWHEARAHG